MRIIQILLILATFSLSAQNFVGKQKVMDPNRSIFSFMGHTVEMTNDYAFVAAPESPYDTAGANPIGQAGIVLVYHRDISGKWNLMQKLQSPNRNNLAQFGWSLAAEDSILVVGARGEWVGFPAGGAAHVFKLVNGKWQHHQRLIPTDTAFQGRFGESVAISWPYIVVGAEKNDLDSTNANALFDAGAAYVFEENAGSWQQADKLSASQGRVSTAYFGKAVAIAGDRLLVGAPDAWLAKPGGGYLYAFGLAYEFARQTNGTWHEVSMLIDTLGPALGGEFGTRIEMSDSLAFISAPFRSIDTTIGAGQVVVMKRSGTHWAAIQYLNAPDAFTNDNFGSSMDFDAGNLVVGVPGQDHELNYQNPITASGAAYWYSTAPTTDSLFHSQKIWATDRMLPNSTFDFFGSDVAIDKGYLLVGARNDDDDTLNVMQTNAAGTAYFFDTICTPKHGSYATNICDGDSLLYTGQYLKVAGSYLSVLKAADGCDSIVTLNLSIDTVPIDSIKTSSCVSYTSPSGNIITNISGIYTDTLISINGCDSLLTIDLTILPASSTSLNLTACNSYALPSGRGIISVSGVYKDTLLDRYGCDSILDLNISINTVDTAVLVDPVNQRIIALANNATFRWLDCENNYALIPGIINDTAGFIPGTYAVEITQNGCIDTSRCVVLRTSGTSNSNLSQNLSIYPNPIKDYFYLDFGQSKSIDKLQVVNMNAEIVGEYTDVHQHTSLKIRVPGGLYFILIKTRDGNTLARKVMVQHQ